MISFIHTADIHFGMENYGKIDPVTGIHSRLLDSKRALDFCIDVAIEKKVDLFIFSGDAYKTANPSPTQQKLLMECFFRLHRQNIPVVIIVGNHDNPLTFGKASALDVFGNLPLDGFYVLTKPTSLRIETKNGPVQLVGIPWPTRTNITLQNAYLYKSASELADRISQAVAQMIRNFAQELDPTIPSMLAGHLTVSSGIFSGSEKRAIYGTDPVFLPSQLSIEPFDYVALGHLHRYQNLNPHGYPALVYAGSIERVDFGERKEDKGFCYVTIEKKGTTKHEFITTPMRPFIQIEITLNDAEDQTEQVLKAVTEHAIQDAIVKIIYHLPEDAQDTVNLKKIQAICSSAMHLVGIIPVRSVTQKTRRIGAKITMDLQHLVETYLNSKPELQKKKEILIKKILELEEQVAQEEIEQE